MCEKPNPIWRQNGQNRNPFVTKRAQNIPFKAAHTYMAQIRKSTLSTEAVYFANVVLALVKLNSISSQTWLQVLLVTKIQDGHRQSEDMTRSVS